jgi:penicillin amidase
METINNQAFLLTDKFPVTVLYGPALRRTIDFSRPLNGYSILPSGQSGNPMSRHYDDQALRYADGKSRREYMDEQEIRSVCKDVLIFR